MYNKNEKITKKKTITMNTFNLLFPQSNQHDVFFYFLMKHQSSIKSTGCSAYVLEHQT